MKKFSKSISLFIVILLAIFALSIPNKNIAKYWHKFALNREFVCPENLTKEQSESYLNKFTNFYITYYPDITFSDFLSRRMEQLVTHKCLITLQNLANQNNGASLNQNSVNELKNMPYGPTNTTLLEMGQTLKKDTVK